MNTTYALLALMVTISIFCRIRSFVFSLILITIWIAFDQHYINHIGIFALSALALLTYSSYNMHIAKRLKNLFLIALGIFAVALMLHYVAGFYNRILFNRITLSPGSSHYSLFFNLDKIFTGLIIYACSHLATTEKAIDEKSLIQTVLIYLASVVVILGPAIISGYVKFDPKISPFLPMWIINNLLFVTFSDEVVFRGLIQNTILSWLPKKTFYTVFGIIIASALFGLYHYRDGLIFIGLSAICGLFYGYAYFKTKRILCAMLVHFLLNLTHIVLFSYPSVL